MRYENMTDGSAQEHERENTRDNILEHAGCGASRLTLAVQDDATALIVCIAQKQAW